MNKALLFGGIAALALAAAGFFVFLRPTTGSLGVSVSGPGGKAVQGVVISIDGAEACSDSVCSVADLEKGTHKVTVSAPGFAPSAPKLVQVKAGEESVLNIELQAEAEKTVLRVSAKASGLTLKVDGKEIGPLPQDVSGLSPGNHEVEVFGSPYLKPFKKTITLREGENLSFEPELELAKGQLTVTLGDNAEGAKILLVGDGKRLAVHKAKLPLKVDIPAGQEFKLLATKRGFEDYEEAITFSVDQPQKTYEVSLTETGSASKPTGSTSSVPRPTSAPTTTTTTTPPAAAPPAPAASGSATLNINSIPVSTVILDGRPLGTTPKVGVSVSAGTHTVIFVHPEHGRKSRTVTVGAGSTATAAVRFP